MSQAVAIIRKVGPESNPNNKRGVHLPGLVFDATFTEKHEIPAEVTDNPVETGVNVSDHMYLKPKKVTLSAGVSDTQLRTFGDDSFGGGSSRARQAFDLLCQMQASFEPFNIQTGLKLYKDMVCTLITPVQDKDTDTAFIFDAEFQEVIFATTQSVTLPRRAKGSTARQAGPSVQRGTVQAAPVADPSKKSAIVKGVGAGFGGGGGSAF